MKFHAFVDGCAGCNTHKAHKGQEELELPRAGEELEDKDAEYGSGQSEDGLSLGFLCVLGVFRALF